MPKYVPSKSAKKFIHYANKGQEALMVANKALALAKLLRTLINVEYKNIDVIDSSTIDAGTYVKSLVLLGQGDGAEQRGGRSVKFTSFYIKGNFSLGAAEVSSRVRLVLVHDTQPNGSQATFAPFESASVRAMKTLGNGKRFKILYDKRYDLEDTGAASTKLWSIYVKKPLHIKYADTTDTISAIQDDNVYLLMISEFAANAPTVTFQSRTRFIDN